jgi:predicted DNA-binding transcriptional regulator YafY
MTDRSRDGRRAHCYARVSTRDQHVRRHRTEAVLRLSPEGMQWLPHLLEPAVVRAARNTASADRDGWTLVTVPLESADSAVRELLRLGPDVEVVAPEQLRTRITAALEAAISTYRQGVPTG